ncbi:SMI1/KNR4 family protein [Cognatiyoonia sp. IB215446]|uniref:SMI1/KNR4 family protein n=1 Tax=Cognatiyoonia sp. IB215446 TaxID=3097355 RepID=UPI002A1473E1|nr:SMI1/KNR4 family protein [Cognatiyoonia sp. IB215446]MDX8350502.1 SMI1/KNR4 family protein [Cognatiyoonia sp. IB215446]
MDITALVEKLHSAHQTYEKLVFDEDYDGVLGKPASLVHINELEKRIGITLPQNYKAFLLRHDGWANFDGEGKLLSVGDHAAEWVKSTVAEWSDIWESEDPNPFANGAVPIMLGEDIENFLVLNPTKRNHENEPVFELYDAMELEDTFQTFFDYLTQEFETLDEMIKDEQDGIHEDDD